MLFVEYENGRAFQWHIGDPYQHNQETVSCVQADGHELNAIAKQFPNVPHCTSPVIRWTGFWAQFIADNFQHRKATL